MRASVLMLLVYSTMKWGMDSPSGGYGTARFGKTNRITSALRVRRAERYTWPRAIVPVRDTIQPITVGLTNPPTAPSVLMTAIPPAAADPVRNAAGMVQKVGMAPNDPAAARASMAMTNAG